MTVNPCISFGRAGDYFSWEVHHNKRLLTQFTCKSTHFGRIMQELCWKNLSCQTKVVYLHPNLNQSVYDNEV